MKKLFILSLLFIVSFFTKAQMVGSNITVPYTNSASPTWPARLYLPIDYATSGVTYCLLVFNHGSGEAGNNLALIYNSTSAGGPAHVIEEGNWPAAGFVNPADGLHYKFIVVCPQSPAWSASGDNQENIIKYMVANYRIDPNRIYGTGLSSGGGTQVEYMARLDVNESNGGTSVRTYKYAASVPMSAATITPIQAWANTMAADTNQVWGFGDQNNDTYGEDTWDQFKLGGFLNIARANSAWFTGNPGSNGLVVFKSGHGPWNTYYEPSYTETFTWKGTTATMNIYQWMLINKRNIPPPTLPTAQAGPAQNIQLPTTTALMAGSGTPGAGQTITSYLWTYVSGPLNFTITNPASATTTITGLVLGDYHFNLKVTNSASQVANSVVNVNVFSNPYSPPTISTTGSATIVLPASSVNATSSFSFQGAGFSSIFWSKFKSPGQAKARLGVLGSSTSAGNGSSTTDSSYVGRLKTYYVNTYGICDSVINLAVSGYNPYQEMPTGYAVPPAITAKLSPQDQPDPAHNVTAILTHHPTHVLINLPSNGYDVLTLTEIKTALDTITNVLTRAGITWYITSSQPRQDATFSTQTLQNYLAQVGDSIMSWYGTHAIDFYDNMTIPGTTQRIATYEYGDSIHFNDAGHRVLSYQVIGTNMFANFATSSSVITSPGAQNTSITNIVNAGTNIFQATVEDSHMQMNSSNITVVQNPPDNPVANAGSNQTITLPISSTTLDGSGSQQATSYAWSLISGPNVPDIASNTSVTTAVHLLISGTYIFQLSINGGVSTSTVTVTVNPATVTPCNGSTYNLIPDPIDSSTYIAPDVPNSYKPGDTLRLGLANTQVNLGNLIGTPSCPIVVTGPAGKKALITQTLVCETCQYVKITGTNGPGAVNGIFIQQDPQIRQQTFFGIEVKGKSKNIEIEQVYEHNVDLGMVLETNENCDSTFNYPYWINDSFNIHNNTIIGTWNEGIYDGNTSPDNAFYDRRPSQCSIGNNPDSTVFYKPAKNGYSHIYNNYIDSTGRGGIQLANAASGISEINNNIIKHSGMNGDDAQGTAISLGLYSRAYVHDNTISNTYTWGIASLGAGWTNIPLRIENNTIDSSGYLLAYNLATTNRQSYDPRTEPTTAPVLIWPQSVEIDTRPRAYTTDSPPGTAIPGQDSTQFWIKSNIIGIHKNAVAINVDDDYPGIQKQGNIICSNVNKSGGNATINVVASVSYSSVCLVPPAVNAGSNQTLSAVTSTIVNGTATAASGSSISSTLWTKISGTGGTIVTPAQLTTNITGLSVGTYVFNLAATDNNSLTTNSQITITINSGIITNGIIRHKKNKQVFKFK